MKSFNTSNKNFINALDKELFKRRNKVQSNSISVSNIIKDVRKNGDKALFKYEKKFNKNSIIIPSKKSISKSISLLDIKIKKQLI